jgi:crotonobetainyl-CoA:carnitine CoA-transferase CaiB-like acyl-CoA transferase
VRNRKALLDEVAGIMRGRTRQAWLELLEPLGVPCGPINSIPEAFADPQARARGTVVEMDHPLSPVPLRLIASPLRFSASPVGYRHPPPVCGEHTVEVLREWLGLDEAAVAALRAAKVV